MKTLRVIAPLLLAPMLLLSACDVAPHDGSDEFPDVGQVSQAAATSGTIAVIDIDLLGQPLSKVDDADNEVLGTIKVFQAHGTPLLASGDLDLARVRATTVALSSNMDLKRRGSSSLGHPKKNYSLDLKGTLALLGMPAEKEWVMHSCYADKSCLRNLLAYWQAAKLFAWAPRTEFAEVFINGEYRGLYLITEKVKLGANRVNLPPPDSGDSSGTYVFKRDGDDPNPDWTSPWNLNPPINYFMVSPKMKDISIDQYRFMQAVTRDVVEPVFTPGRPEYNPARYRDVMSQTAAIDFIIVQELANNIDAYWKSMHLTKQRDGRVYMGPIWDLDLGFANAGNLDSDVCRTDVWRIEDTGAKVYPPLREMWKVSAFRQAFKDRFNTLRNDGRLSRSSIDTLLDSMATRLGPARARDNKKWNTIGRQTWWECTVKPTYLAEVAELKRWSRARLDWMDAKVRNDPAFVP